MAEHRLLTGASLHEPKGAETATVGTVYISDGAGSGNWAVPQNTLSNRVVVKQASDLAGTLSSSTEYFIDGVIDMGTQTIEVPAGGLSFAGYNFDTSKLVSSANNYTMFTSPVGGSGNLVGKDYAVEVTGTNSKVYDLVDATGFNAFEFARINYNNCTSLGEIDGYRQGFESGTGRFGGSPTLTLSGTWLGGYFIDSSIVRNLDAGMTTPLFKSGTGFTMNSRFRTNMNVDLPASAALLDFAPTNFVNASTLQITDAIISRNGVFDTTDTNITPNITASDLKCAWKGNKGLTNTFVGGTMEITAEAATTITVAGVLVDPAGTWTTSDLQHYSQTAAGEPGFRHDGESPNEFLVTYDIVLVGPTGADLVVAFVKDDGVSPTLVSSQTRLVNALVGGRDVAFFNKTFAVTLDKDDELFVQVTNNTNTTSITAELSSFVLITER